MIDKFIIVIPFLLFIITLFYDSLITYLQYTSKQLTYSTTSLMQKLKFLLASKKPQSKLIIQKQQIQKHKQQYQAKQKQHKQRQQQLALLKHKQLDQFYSVQSGKKKIKIDQTNKIQIPLTNQQIKQQLEKLYQPDRIEGELDQTRYKRLLRMQKIHTQYPQIDMKTFDEGFYRRLKQKQYFQQLDLKYRQKMIEPKLIDDKLYRQKKLRMILADKQKDFYIHSNFEEACDLSYIWLVKLLRDWKEKLDQKHGRQQIGTRNNKLERFHQTQLEIAGLLKVLKHKTGDKDMLLSIYHIMNCCLVREYVQANDKYLDLSIGKAPWPMGVAMLGITVKRNALKLSHVLSDQMTRKWVQSIKRLITVSQQLYPNEDQMKMVYLGGESMV